MASVRSASLNGGLHGAEPHAVGSRGRAPGRDQEGQDPLKLKAFCPFSCLKVAKS